LDLGGFPDAGLAKAILIANCLNIEGCKVAFLRVVSADSRRAILAIV
jgi:hypothetical protein